MLTVLSFGAMAVATAAAAAAAAGTAAVTTAGAAIATLTISQVALISALAGGIGGAIGGAISGGGRGALMGLAMGFAGGAISGGVGQALAQTIGRAATIGIMTGAGAGLSYAQGGWKGLVTFGIGVAAAFATSSIMGAMQNRSARTAETLSAGDARIESVLADQPGGDVTDPVDRMDAGPAGGSRGGGGGTDFVVTPKGTAVPVPDGATGPVPVINPSGNQTGIAYTGGSGGTNGQVTTLRIMDPTPSRGANPGYPNGYIKFENTLRQGVNPYTGQTVSPDRAHYPLY